MRGGIFESGYALPTTDFKKLVRAFNRETFTRHTDFLDGLDAEIDRQELLEKASALGDIDLIRLVVPIVYHRAARSSLSVLFDDGVNLEVAGISLDRMTAREIFRRTGEVLRVDVRVSAGLDF